MQTIREYFQQRDTPAAGSPTGLAMIELLKLDSTITFEEARRLVNDYGASASTAGPKGIARAIVSNRTQAAA
jgi:hypothetical protein